MGRLATAPTTPASSNASRPPGRPPVPAREPSAAPRPAAARVGAATLSNTSGVHDLNLHRWSAALAGGPDLGMAAVLLYLAWRPMKSPLVGGGAMMTWILRLVGFIVMWIGISMVFGPFTTFADVIPFVGDLLGMGVGFFSFILAAVIAG